VTVPARAATLAAVAVLAVVAAACAPAPSPSPSLATPTIEPTAISTPEPPTPSPVAPIGSPTVAPTVTQPPPAPELDPDAIFGDVPGTSFGDADEGTVAALRTAIAAALGGTGELADIVTAGGRQRDSATVTVAVVSVAPAGSATTVDIQDAIATGLAADVGGAVEPGLDGLGVVIRGDSTVSAVALAADGAQPVFVVATGDPDAPVERVALDLLGVFFGG
jgi:hypothetical protein